MRLKRNKSGFTLLEIIIVVIIIGVLASLALPRLFKTVNFSKGAEALSQLGAIRGAMERCYLMNNQSYANCGLANLDVDIPEADTTNFDYSAVVAASTFTVTATGNSPVSGTISINQAGVKAGTGDFSSIQN